ncbi:MAG: mechanosensitive ion channel family protein [Arenimonas sp.]
MPDLRDLVDAAAEHAMTHEWVWRALGTIALILVGLWLCRRVVRILDRVMARVEMDAILRGFLRNLTYAISVVVVFIAALDFAGVPTTSLLAVVGAVGLGIGLAVKDSLSNIASGVMLIVLRPFRAGDVVQVAGIEGTVDSVRIFQTHLHTPDNRTVILPNSQITTAAIVNHSTRGGRRLEVAAAISYDDDLAAARATLLDVARANARVRRDPAPDVIVAELTDAKVVLQLRAWVAPDDLPAARAELQEAAWQQFVASGLRAPTPQRLVHVHHHGANVAGFELQAPDAE